MWVCGGFLQGNKTGGINFGKETPTSPQTESTSSNKTEELQKSKLTVLHYSEKLYEFVVVRLF